MPPGTLQKKITDLGLKHCCGENYCFLTSTVKFFLFELISSTAQKQEFQDSLLYNTFRIQDVQVITFHHSDSGCFASTIWSQQPKALVLVYANTQVMDSNFGRTPFSCNGISFPQIPQQYSTFPSCVASQFHSLPDLLNS